MTAIRGAVRRKPWVSGAVAGVVVLGGGGATWWAVSDGSPASAETSYRLVAASTGTIKQSVSSTGTVEPADQESLNFAASGQVTSVRVAAGATVRKGQVLGTIDSASLAAALAEAEATLASDQARLESDQEQSADATQVAADQAAVTAAQGQVDSARSAMSGATLRSPIDGIVASVDVAVGDQVTGGSGGSGGGGNNNGSNGSDSGSTANFVVVGTTSWIVTASVDDTQVGLLKKGNQAEITTDGGQRVYGTITSVGLIASSTSGSATFPVTVKVTGNPSGLHAGATATVSLVYKQLTNVLTVPALAVHVGNSGSYVEQLVGGKRVRRSVTTGLSSGGQTQIVSGLKEGDQVVVDIPQLTNRSGSTRGGNGGKGGFGELPGGGVVNGNFPGGAVIDKGGAAPQGGK
ncbi:MAG TPA: biotin/lipoyl-binding protein [Jatrophihabitantaceae bacterium]|nr:biotin/lipoyl-binding protein [Jatrophihabitantaceae bacterium]